MIPKIKVGYLMSINRTSPLKDAEDNMEIFYKIKAQSEYAPYLVGIELSGDPRSGDFNTFKSLFTTAKSAGIKISLHCGEEKGQLDTQDMIDFEPDRFGHCCTLTED